jgi:membrane-associated phospholipid phosphatase
MRTTRTTTILGVFAAWISRVFHPFVISPIMLMTIQLLTGHALVESIGWTVFTIIVLILPTLLFVIHHVRRGRYEDIDVSLRQDRYLLYGLAGGCFLLLIALLWLLAAPTLVQVTLQAALVAFIIAALLNRFVGKVSLHMLAIGGCTALLYLISWPLAVVMATMSLLVGWSRLYLTRHTLPEIVLGWLVGGISFLSWISPAMR